MKALVIAASALLLSMASAQAQAPNRFSYQSVIRNSSGSILANSQVGVKISILKTSATGNVEYSERHTPTTNANGLVDLVIGSGTLLSGSLTNIDWNSGSYYIKTEIDPAGGTSYSIAGTSQLLSVPYALNAANGNWVRSGNNIVNSNSGNVGIGTTTPSDLLQVGSYSQTRNNYISVKTAGGNSYRSGIRLWHFADDNGFTIESNEQANRLDFIRHALGTFNAMSIDRLNGNVGIGTTSPATKLHVLANNEDAILRIESPGGANEARLELRKFGTLGDAAVGFFPGNSDLRFRTSTSTSFVFEHGTNERMRISDNGNIGIGTTNPNRKLSVVAAAPSNAVGHFSNSANNSGTFNDGLHVFAGVDNFSNAFNSALAAFRKPNGTWIGGIQQVSGNSIAYNTTSDLRLKTGVRATRFGLKDLMKIDVKDYVYKNDLKTEQTGFIAQQLFDVYPMAVTKGGDDADARPWMVDYGKLTPLLVSAIQEQQKEIEQLKKENQRLENQIEVELKSLKAKMETLTSAKRGKK